MTSIINKKIITYINQISKVSCMALFSVAVVKAFFIENANHQHTIILLVLAICSGLIYLYTNTDTNTGTKK